MFYLIKKNKKIVFFYWNQITVFNSILANINILYSIICCYFLFKRSCWRHDFIADLNHDLNWLKSLIKIIGFLSYPPCDSEDKLEVKMWNNVKQLIRNVTHLFDFINVGPKMTARLLAVIRLMSLLSATLTITQQNDRQTLSFDVVCFIDCCFKFHNRTDQSQGCEQSSWFLQRYCANLLDRCTIFDLMTSCNLQNHSYSRLPGFLLLSTDTSQLSLTIAQFRCLSLFRLCSSTLSSPAPQWRYLLFVCV